ncbi:MAG: hypothetical protein AAB036_00520 [Elusimicrobiota bacterium]
MNPPSSDVVVLALDRNEDERAYYYFRPSDPDTGTRFFSASDLPDAPRIMIALFPTKTYSEGLGGAGSERSPEDRALIRAVSSRFPGRTLIVSMGESAAADSGEREALVEFKPAMLREAPRVLRECWTTPNRQDYMYLLTKTFGLNLVVRLFFTVKAVHSGDLPLLRAVLSTSWYQLQDTVFTVFGQTYMKFLGRMTGMLRMGPVKLGDFAFVYVQLCFFEFLNRLVLGPLGENPLVYTWHGMGLIFVNIIQGMISGGPLIPAINKMRRAGIIRHSTMMHCYQLTSLTMQFGLFASFGYQRFYFALTTGTLILSWSVYALFSLFFQDPPCAKVDASVIARLRNLATLAPAL